MSKLTCSEFYQEILDSPIMKKNVTVGIYVYHNDMFVQYFELLTNNEIWESFDLLFEHLTGGAFIDNTFVYVFIDPNYRIFIKEDNLDVTMSKLKL